MFGWFKSKSKPKPKTTKSSKTKNTSKAGTAKSKRKSSGRYKDWESKRTKTFERDDHRCQKCGATTHLQAHHKSYRPERLTTLCRSCHKKEHGIS